MASVPGSPHPACSSLLLLLARVFFSSATRKLACVSDVRGGKNSSVNRLLVTLVSALPCALTMVMFCVSLAGAFLAVTVRASSPSPSFGILMLTTMTSVLFVTGSTSATSISDLKLDEELLDEDEELDDEEELDEDETEDELLLLDEDEEDEELDDDELLLLDEDEKLDDDELLLLDDDDTDEDEEEELEEPGTQTASWVLLHADTWICLAHEVQVRASDPPGQYVFL